MIRRLFGARRLAQVAGDHKLTTIRVAKAYCSPSRVAISGAFRPYGIWFDAPDNDHWSKEKDAATGWPMYQWADVTVRESQARWAEYVILSIKTPQGARVFDVLSKPKDPRNERWTAQRRGLPMPWALKSGKLDVAWIAHDCPAAREAGAQDGQGRTASHKDYGGVIFTSERAPRPSRPPRQRPPRRARKAATGRKRR